MAGDLAGSEQKITSTLLDADVQHPTKYPCPGPVSCCFCNTVRPFLTISSLSPQLPLSPISMIPLLSARVSSTSSGVTRADSFLCAQKLSKCFHSKHRHRRELHPSKLDKKLSYDTLRDSKISSQSSVTGSVSSTTSSQLQGNFQIRMALKDSLPIATYKSTTTPLLSGKNENIEKPAVASSNIDHLRLSRMLRYNRHQKQGVTKTTAIRSVGTDCMGLPQHPTKEASVDDRVLLRSRQRKVIPSTGVEDDCQCRGHGGRTSPNHRMHHSGAPPKRRIHH